MYKNHSSNCVSLRDFVLKVLKVLGLYKAIDTVTSSMKYYKGGQSWSTRYWLELIRYWSVQWEANLSMPQCTQGSAVYSYPINGNSSFA